MYVVDKKTDIVALYVNDSEMMELDQKSFDSLISANRKMSNDFSLNTGDSSNGQLAAKFRDAGLEVYLLETTSDKEINARQYRDSAIMGSANGGWTKDFQKPILTDHIISSNWGDSPTMLGRVKDSYYVRRDTGKVMSCTKNDLPNQVKAYFLDKEKQGTGFNILKADINDKGVQGIIDGEFVTFSQGSIYTKADCNICGHNYYSEDCSHRVGQTYEKDSKQIKCVPILDGRRPVEVSQVFAPANDTSQKIVFNKKTGKIMSDEEVIKLLNDTTQSGSNDSSNDGEGEMTNDSVQTEKPGSNANKDNQQEGGTKVALNSLLKNAVLDGMELQLEKVANSEFADKMLAIFEDVKTDDEVDLMRKVAKVIGTSKANDFKFSVETATNDSKEGEESSDSEGDNAGENESKDNSQQEEIDMTNMTDAQKAAFEKMKKDLAEVNEKLVKANDTISNNPFGTGESDQGSEESSNDSSKKDTETNVIIETGSYFPGV